MRYNVLIPTYVQASSVYTKSIRQTRQPRAASQSVIAFCHCDSQGSRYWVNVYSNLHVHFNIIFLLIRSLETRQDALRYLNHVFLAISGLPNQWIKPQWLHINVTAVRFAQSNPSKVIPAVFSMAEPLRNFVCLQWLHSNGSLSISYSQGSFFDIASMTSHIGLQ